MSRNLGSLPLLAALAIWTQTPGLACGASYTQQGDRVVAPVAANAGLGQSVAIAGDGNTVIVGAPHDLSEAGSAWIFRRTGSTWDAGTSLTIPSTDAPVWAGRAVAISADGSTAVVGGPRTNAFAGAIWIYTRDASGAYQLHSKVTEPGPATVPEFGWSVGVSGNGDRIIVGGTLDDSPYTPGAAWVFARSGGNWLPEGAPLVDPTADAKASQGWSVAISKDGTTAIVGGVFDGMNIGAAWVYGASAGGWALQQKLDGFVTEYSFAGTSVALSENGNDALVGAPFEGMFGMARLYHRSSGTWNATGTPVFTPDLPAGHTQGLQGFSVSLSGDGQTLVLGEPGFDSFPAEGRTWIYSPPSGGPTPTTGTPVIGATGGMPADPLGGQGWSCAISDDGSTVIVGAVQDTGGKGAFWIFDREPLAQVAISLPCPAVFIEGRTSEFGAVVTGAPAGVTPAFSWSLSPSGAGTISGPTTGNKVVVDWKKPLPGPITGSLCVSVTVGGDIISQCTPVGVMNASGLAGLKYGIAALACRSVNPKGNFWRLTEHWIPPNPYSREELAGIGRILKQMSADLQTAQRELPRPAKPDSRKTDKTARASR